MQFIQRVHWFLRERRRSLRRIRRSAEFLMTHLGLEGHCECAWSLNERNRLGLLLRMETLDHVPWAERAQFQVYFRRKLGQLRELQRLDDWDFEFIIVDADDRVRRRLSHRSPVSSRAMVALVRRHNQNKPRRVAPPDQPQETGHKSAPVQTHAPPLIMTEHSPLE